MTALTVADALDEAAAVIRRNGWHQGGFYRMPSNGRPENCPVCAMGAINIAVFDKPVASDLPQTPEQSQLAYSAYVSVERFLGADTGLGGWNDMDGRTVDEVVDALKGAARAERERAA